MSDNEYFEEETVEEEYEEKGSGAGKIILTIFITMLLTLAACAGAYYWFIYRKQQNEKPVEPEQEIVVEEPKIIMPELRGFSVDQAADILGNLGLDFFKEDAILEFSDSIAEGLVTSCEPLAGSTVDKNVKIVIKASKGKENTEPEPISTPKVNKTEDIIIKVLDSNLRIRDYPSTTEGNRVGKVNKNTVLTAHEVYGSEGYTWYRIADNEWIADDGTWVKEIASKPKDGSFTIRVMDYNIKIRSTPEVKEETRTGSQVSKNTILTAYETKTADGYMWYRIGENQWIADDGTWVSIVK